MTVEATLRLRHRGCYSEHLPAGTRVVHLSGDGASCLCQVHAPTEERPAILRAMQSWLESAPAVLAETSTAALVRCTCPRRGLTTIFSAAGANVLWPVLHADGWERWRLVTETRTAMERVLEEARAVGDVEVLSLREPKVDDTGFPLRDLLSHLSPRQMEALTLALRRGYYDLPRRATLEELAASVGLSPSTFQEHLQKAHREVMGGLGALFAASPDALEAARKGPGRPPRRPPSTPTRP